MQCPLIIGDDADPHVVAVVAQLVGRDAPPVVIDSASLSRTRWRRSTEGFEVAVDGSWRQPARGWLRRLAPAGHHSGMELGGLSAAEAVARLALIASLSEAGVLWLTDYWSTLRAENKLVQYRLAAAAGIPVPSTRVVTNPMDLRLDPALGDPVVMKPLGVGEFRRDGEAFAIHARLVRRDNPVLEGMSVAPFIAQQRIDAVRHLRVVTVDDDAWAAELDATDLPLDWRQSGRAHLSWASTSAPDLTAMAARVARSLGAGYTSQDWIEDEDGKCWFIDGNPGGQWLFLPDEVAVPVTKAIANWLAAGS